MFDDPGDFGDGLAAAGSEDLPDLAAMRRLFEVARGPGTAEELSNEQAIVHSMSLAVAARAPGAVDELAHRRTTRDRIRGTRTATRVAIVAAGILIGTSTAAATGSLPDVAQSVVARATSHIGIDIPNPDSEGGSTTPATTSPPTDSAPTDSIPVDGSVPTDGSAPVPTSVPGDGSAPAAGIPPETDTVDDGTVATPPDDTDVPPDTGASDGGVPTPAVTTSTAPDAPRTTPAPTTTDPDRSGSDATTDPTTATTAPELSAAAKVQLCREWFEHPDIGSPDEQSGSMRRLVAAADAAGLSIGDFCADVVDPPEVPTTATVPDETIPPATVTVPSDPPVTDPSTTDPATTEPATSEPTTSEPTTTEPATTEPPTTDATTPSTEPDGDGSSGTNGGHGPSVAAADISGIFPWW